jgi:hypothetical protein
MTLALPLYLRRGAAGLAALLLTACPGKPDETGTDGESSGDSTAGMSTTSGGATTGESPTTSGAMSDGTMGGGMTTGGQSTAVSTTTTSGDTTTAGTTGDEPPPELVDACTAACETFFECIMPPPFPNMEECIAGCTEAADGGTPECVAASVAFDVCIAGLDCPEFNDAVMNEDFGECADEFEASETMCVTCESFAGVGPDGCSLGQICPDMPMIEISCEGDTCTCLVDDVPQDECAANGVCAEDMAALQQLAAECCGFEL